MCKPLAAAPSQQLIDQNPSRAPKPAKRDSGYAAAEATHALEKMKHTYLIKYYFKQLF